MRPVALSFITLSGLALFGQTLLHGESEPVFGIVGLALAAAWLLLTWKRGKAGPSAFLIALAGLSCASAAQGGGVLLPSVAAAAALFAWDACLAGARLRADAEGGSRRIARRYALTSWILLGIGVAVAMTAQWIELRLSYGLAIGMALALLLGWLIAVRLLGASRGRGDGAKTGDEGSDQEQAGRRKSPGSPSHTGSIE